MNVERLVEVEKEVESVKQYIVPEMGRRFDKLDDRFDKLEERLEHQSQNTERIIDLTYEIKTLLADNKRMDMKVEGHESRLLFLEKYHSEGKREREVKNHTIKVVVATAAVAVFATIWKFLGG